MGLHELASLDSLETLEAWYKNHPLALGMLYDAVTFSRKLRLAKRYLVNCGLVPSVILFPSYYDWIRQIFFDVVTYGLPAATSHVQTDLTQYVDWGLSREALIQVAAIVGISGLT